MITVIDKNGTPHKYDSNTQCPLGQRNVIAKDDNGKLFYILASSDGVLFNPNEIDKSINKKDRERGRYYYQLERCNKQCFISYITFLRSKNITHMLIAQRRFLDGR